MRAPPPTVGHLHQVPPPRTSMITWSIKGTTVKSKFGPCPIHNSSLWTFIKLIKNMENNVGSLGWKILRSENFLHCFCKNLTPLENTAGISFLLEGLRNRSLQFGTLLRVVYIPLDGFWYPSWRLKIPLEGFRYPSWSISESLQWNYKPTGSISESLQWNYKPWMHNWILCNSMMNNGILPME